MFILHLSALVQKRKYGNGLAILIFEVLIRSLRSATNTKTHFARHANFPELWASYSRIPLAGPLFIPAYISQTLLSLRCYFSHFRLHALPVKFFFRFTFSRNIFSFLIMHTQKQRCPRYIHRHLHMLT